VLGKPVRIRRCPRNGKQASFAHVLSGDSHWPQGREGGRSGSDPGLQARRPACSAGAARRLRCVAVGDAGERIELPFPGFGAASANHGTRPLSFPGA